MKSYSKFFETIYDEENDNRYHHSILRLNFSDSYYNAFDFAIIWDEDHDERILDILNELYNYNLLYSGIAYGEREGGFSMMSSYKFKDFNDYKTIKRLCTEYNMIESFCSDYEDPWNFDVDESYIIDYVKNYNLNKKWKLGLKHIK